jgi:glutamine---fructose-6-phosphate transaminase (isomerizing)
MNTAQSIRPGQPGYEPDLRAARPWLMDEMIAIEPELCRRIGDLQTDAVRSLIRLASSVTVTGCGTSEHAAMAIAEQLRTIHDSVRSEQALEVALDPPSDDLVIAVSHEGESAATLAAMRAARAAGSTVALVTAVEGSAAAELADATIVTPIPDASWCHTVGYLSPVLVGGRLAGGYDAGELAAVATAADRLRHRAVKAAAALSGARLIHVAGSGVDRISARELCLKIAEGARLPAIAHDLETLLHGHLATAEPGDGLIVFVSDPRHRRSRHSRAAQALRAASELGMTSLAVVAADRLGLEAQQMLLLPAARSPLTAMTAAAVTLQVLTVELAAARGVNPDLIRREDARQRAAADAVQAWRPETEDLPDD